VSSTARTIGIVSDTHIPHRITALPAALFAALRGCELILHAGDLEDPAILRLLKDLAPVHAVRGNLHWQYSTGTHDQDLPLSVTVALPGHVLWLTHGHFRFAYSIVDKLTGYLSKRKLDGVNDMLIARLRRMRPRAADIVVFGHSHRSTARVHDNALFFNPGAVAANPEISKEGPRVAKLHLRASGQIDHEWIDV
jgi:uncharacterized protein